MKKWLIANLKAAAVLYALAALILIVGNFITRLAA